MADRRAECKDKDEMSRNDDEDITSVIMPTYKRQQKWKKFRDYVAYSEGWLFICIVYEYFVLSWLLNIQ